MAQRFASFFVFTLLSLPLAFSAVEDPNQWLEEIESPQALDWARAHNDKTIPFLTGLSIHQQIEPEIRKIVLATDRIPSPTLMGNFVYNFWQDTKNVRGLWRRATLESYSTAQISWETVLDLDALASAEKENWVWKGADCLAPHYQKCLLQLSNGGKDAVTVREWDTQAKAFVAGGFTLAEAKSRVAWLDNETLLLGTDFGPGSLTLSGYPRVVKAWKRGTKLETATTLYEGKTDDMMVNAQTFHGVNGAFAFISRRVAFFEQELFRVGEQNKITPLPLPLDVEIHGVVEGRLLFSNKKVIGRGKQSYVAGSLLALPLTKMKPDAAFEVLYAPTAHTSVSQVTITGQTVLVNLLDDVKGKLIRLQRGTQRWKAQNVAFPLDGTLNVVAADEVSENAFVSYESFLTPPSLYLLVKQEPTLTKQLPARFEASAFETKQQWAKSKDGVNVPYFVVQKKGLKLDGSHPTLLYGYGGFLLAQKPSYLSATGKVWLERGGVYALANIRGGNEFGPGWHQAALREKRQSAFNDFIAVAEDLIAKKITSPAKLGIRGGSNGGLLMGAMLTQRPELFGAIVCQVPLLDMLRFHKLLAGHSWTAEYGNPDNAKDAEYIAKYSPYQNVKAGVKYPKMFVLTSTKDDRVHPGHARKMVAKLETLSQPVLYYENIEGGHGGAANLEQTIRNTALYFSYLWDQLGTVNSVK